VLEHVPALGRRVVYRRRLGRAYDAVYEEGHYGDHQDARDAERDCHLDKRHSFRGLLHERLALAPSGSVRGRNHGIGFTVVRIQMAPPSHWRPRHCRNAGAHTSPDVKLRLKHAWSCPVQGLCFSADFMGCCSCRPNGESGIW
jgi:hypothetical protein